MNQLKEITELLTKHSTQSLYQGERYIKLSLAIELVEIWLEKSQGNDRVRYNKANLSS